MKGRTGKGKKRGEKTRRKEERKYGAKKTKIK